jgi:sugar phosphate isomerase/epimerase
MRHRASQPTTETRASAIPLGVTTWTLPTRGEKAIGWARHQGFGFVHLDTDDVAGVGAAGIRTLRATASNCGVRLAGLALSSFETVGIRDRHGSRQIVERGLDVARKLDIGFIYLPSFGAAEIRSEDDLLRTAELLCHVLERSDIGMTVASESHLSAESTIRLFDMISDPRACLLFDTQNPVLAGHDPAELARIVGYLIGPYVHVKDGRLHKGDAIIGHGVSRVAATINALTDGGFSGSFVLEGEYRVRPTRHAQADQRALRCLIDRSADRSTAP